MSKIVTKRKINARGKICARACSRKRRDYIRESRYLHSCADSRVCSGQSALTDHAPVAGMRCYQPDHERPQLIKIAGELPSTSMHSRFPKAASGGIKKKQNGERSEQCIMEDHYALNFDFLAGFRPELKSGLLTKPVHQKRFPHNYRHILDRSNVAIPPISQTSHWRVLGKAAVE